MYSMLLSRDCETWQDELDLKDRNFELNGLLDKYNSQSVIEQYSRITLKVQKELENVNS